MKFFLLIKSFLLVHPMGALKHGMWMQRELSVISAQLNHFQGISQLYAGLNILKVTKNIAVFLFFNPYICFLVLLLAIVIVFGPCHAINLPLTIICFMSLQI